MAIFINYRRKDAKAIAGRIDEHLRREFGGAHVFIDVDSIPLGVDFTKHIVAEVSKCDVFLAIIGERWLTDRLREKTDFVRIEIESALSRDIPVIPVLVDGGTLPEKGDLPPSLRPLVNRNGIAIESGRTFNAQMKDLVDGIRLIGKGKAPERVKPADTRLKLPVVLRKRLIAGLGVLVAAVIAAVVGLMTKESDTEELPQASQPAAEEVAPANALSEHAGKPEELPQAPEPSVGKDEPENTPVKNTPVKDVIHSERGGYVLVRIPGGEFLMGSPRDGEGKYNDERPSHKVKVADFYLGRYPVTNEQYGEFLEANPSVAKPVYWKDSRFNQPSHPVVGVSWSDAKTYSEWVGLRLPSEAEWEYAARGGTQTRYYSGDAESDLARVGWYRVNSDDRTHPVGEKKESHPFGLYNMHGNVWEWMEDDWHRDYDGAPAEPVGRIKALLGVDVSPLEF